MEIWLAIQLMVQGLLLGGIYGLIAVGLSLIFGVMGVINFAHGQMMVVGMYISYWILVLTGLDPYLSLIFVAAVTAVIGYLIQATVVNRILDFPEAMQVVPLVSIGLIVENCILFLWGHTPFCFCTGGWEWSGHEPFPPCTGPTQSVEYVDLFPLCHGVFYAPL